MLLKIITGLIIGTGMSFFMSGIITIVNTGIDPEYLSRWMKAWVIAWSIATPIAIIISPIARKYAIHIESYIKGNIS